MASFGQVLDLLDGRYLNLHDVVGNVEPMPTLVPYNEWGQAVLVLRMDTHHELFMALMHEFTERMAHESRQELWTWLVQWEVESCDDSQLKVEAPSPKKPRLQTDEHNTELARPEPRSQAPIVDIFERCIIKPELMQEEDVLRILLDIVQADSRYVPNFIEFLYRWVDFYEGDGTALKAALKWEIPSLWDFEHHPVMIPEDIRKQTEKYKAEKEKDNEKLKAQEQDGMSVNTSYAQDLAHGSSTKKMRQKPDLAAFERQVLESERLQYREVKYGIRPPKLNLPMPKLINIPQDTPQRLRYYAACFKSRHRALIHLMESGLSMQQISNYRKPQKEHPMDTPETLEEGPPKELKGLQHYYKDADAAQGVYAMKEKLQLQREKQKEIAISSKLAVEAQLAAAAPTPSDTVGIPLIPPTPSYARPPDMAGDMLRKIQTAKFEGPEAINFVPTAVVGLMKSDLFAEAQDRHSYVMPRATSDLSQNSFRQRPVQDDTMDAEEYSEDDNDEGEDGDGEESDVENEDDEEEGSDSDESSDDDDNDPQEPPQSAAPANLHRSVPSAQTGGPPTGAQTQNPPNLAGQAYRSPLHGRQTATVNALFQHLAPQAAQSLLPLTDPRSRPVLAADIARRMTGNQIPTLTNTTSAPPRIPSAGTNGPSSQSRSASLPFLPPPPGRPPTVPFPPGGSRPTLPFLSPPRRPTAQNLAPASRPNAPSLGKRSASFQSYGQPLVSMPPRANSSTGQLTPRAVFGLPPSPQTFRLRHDRPRAAAMKPFPASHFPPIPGAPGLVAPEPQPILAQPTSMQHRSPHLPPAVDTFGTMVPPVSGLRIHSLGHHTAASSMHQPPTTASSMQRPAPPPITVTPASAQQSPTEQSRMAPQLQQGPPRSQGSGDTRSLHDQLETHNPSQPLHRSAILAPLSSNARANYDMQASPSPSAPMLSPPRLGIQRNAPAPLNLPPPPASPSPFASLGPSLLATTPFLQQSHGVPVQMYLPKVVVPGNGIGPGGRRMGTEGIIETDALMIGYVQPGTGKITLSRALFLPLGVWTNTQRRVNKKAYSMIETYPAPLDHPAMKGKTGAIGNGPCHAAVYRKLTDAYNMMRSSSAKQRELNLTKRWRASKGPMTQQDRGAVWEGYGVTLDKPIEMTAKEREGAIIWNWIVDEGVDKKHDSRKAQEELEEDDENEDMEDLDDVDRADVLGDDPGAELTWGSSR